MDRIEEEQIVFGSLFLAANKIQTAGDHLLPEVTLKQWFLLLMISKMDRQSPSITEIAEFSGNTRQNVKKMVDILTEKGFLIVRRQTDDRRNLCVHLTPKTFDFFATHEQAGNQFLQVIFRDIPSENLKITADTFSRLIENLATVGDHYEHKEQ
jgi:DNA-binding MarR family transcriptional regulator